jgi:hypothetical protein
MLSEFSAKKIRRILAWSKHSDGFDEALRIRILLRRPRCCQHFAHADLCTRQCYKLSVNRISVMQQIAQGAVPLERFGDLLGGPFAVGWAVTLKCITRRLRWARLRRNNMRYVTVGATWKSVGINTLTWFSRNVRHAWEGAADVDQSDVASPTDELFILPEPWRKVRSTANH